MFVRLFCSVCDGRWHLAINLEESIAVTQNYVSMCNVHTVLQYFRGWRKRGLLNALTRRLPHVYPKEWAQIEREHREREALESALSKHTSAADLLPAPKSLWDEMLAGGNNSATASSTAAADDSAASFTFASLGPAEPDPAAAELEEAKDAIPEDL